MQVYFIKLQRMVLIGFTLFFCLGCISSILKEPAPQFSTEIIVPSAPERFSALKTSTYPSWKNESTQNVISLISDCKNSSYNLMTVHDLIAGAMETPKVQEEKMMQVNGRASYFKKTTGQIDGAAIQTFSTSLRHNNCYYLSFISGNPERISQDLSAWNEFNKKIDFKK